MWRQRYWAVIALMVLTAVCCGTNWHVELKRSSGGRISHGDELIADIMPGLHLEGWRLMMLEPDNCGAQAETM